MNDFTFYSPTKLMFGKDKEKQIGIEIANRGIKKVLLVHGKHSAIESGLIDRVKECLDYNCIKFFTLGGIESNPGLLQVKKGIDIVKENYLEAVLAVGGGSVIDVAKAIAAGYYMKNVWDVFTGNTITSALPIFTIPTLAGSGSEMNSGMVITNEETRQKFIAAAPCLYPVASIVNPALTMTAPPFVTYCGIVDAFSHAVEPYLTAVQGNQLIAEMIEVLARTLIRATGHIPPLCIDDYDLRAELSWATILAGSGMPVRGWSGYSFPFHIIAHSLSALRNTPHGAALSIIIPAWIRWAKVEKHARINRFSEKVIKIPEELEKWFIDMKLPTRLRDIRLTIEDIPEIAENAFEGAKQMKVDQVYTKDAISHILGLAL